MKSFFTCLLLLLSLSAFTQNKRPQIEFCPLCLIDELTFPTIQGGFEFRLTEKFGWYNEIGLKYRKGYYEDADTSFIGSKGFKVKSEIRYYIHTKQPAKNAYIAINGFYNNDTHNAAIEYYHNNDSTKSLVDNFGVKKSVAGANLLIGTKKKLGNKFALDLYAGLGVRFVNIAATHKEFDKKSDQLRLPIDVTVAGTRARVDATGKTDNIGNLALGIRLTYSL